MNLLDASLLSTTDRSGREILRRTLPGVLAAAGRGEIGDFPAVRPHQRHVWHALLVQLAALALVAADDDRFADDEGEWRDRLARLTPDAADTAWSLVAPPERPAFLQAPVPGGDLSAFKRTITTPDDLDMLVMSKQHDLKAGAMANAAPEHWVYALVSLQTQEGYGGGKGTLHGVSRMNSGYGSRPGFGIDPDGTSGGRIVRDVRRLVAARDETIETSGFRAQNGLALVWLHPWDGISSLALSELAPFYVEICRRVRLAVGRDGRIGARAAGSKAARIEAKALKGVTGDPWTPLIVDGDGRKALTVDASGLGYRRLVPLLFPKSTDAAAARVPLLQETAADDPEIGLEVSARVLVRGQGKTEGYFERRIPISRRLRRLMRERATDRVAALAAERVEDAGEFARRVVYPAALAAFTGAPRTETGERARDDDTAKNRAGRERSLFDTLVDETFFAALDRELEVLDDPAEAAKIRFDWYLDLHVYGRRAVERALADAPDAAARHWRTRVRVSDLYAGCFGRFLDARADPTLVTAWRERRDLEAEDEEDA